MFYNWMNWLRATLGQDLVPGGPIVAACVGCEKATSLMCSVYPNPQAFWNRGGCYFNVEQETKTVGKKRVGQQKQKKGV